MQSIGLLGVLNDSLIASDPGIPLYDGKTPYNNAIDKDKIRWIYPFFGIGTALMPMKLGADPERPSYWNNVSVRMGALRTDGAYLGAPGVSGNTSTIKYLYSPDKLNRKNKLNFQPDSVNGNCVSMWAKTTWHHDDSRNHEFFNPGNVAGVGQCSGYMFQKMGQYKFTRRDACGGGHCANRSELNDLFALSMHQTDSGYAMAIHGGYEKVDPTLSPNESPGYHVQPFRWSFLGIRANYTTQVTSANNPPPGAIYPRPPSQTYKLLGLGVKGHMNTTDDWMNPSSYATMTNYLRPFIDTELFPEGPANWSNGPTSLGVRLKWGYTGNSPYGGHWKRDPYDPTADPPAPATYTWNPEPTPHLTVGDSRDVVGGPTSVAAPDPIYGGRDGEGQDAKWVWADPYGKIAPDPDKPTYSLKSFGINNLNYGNANYSTPFVSTNARGSSAVYWHYRNLPEDGTYAVIDELKISNKERIVVDGTPDWTNDRVLREMQLSRYYLPPSPGTRQDPTLGGPPTFTSQTLLQSLKGTAALVDTQNVAVIRVSWNVFTPRFMCEYKTPGAMPGAKFTRNENLTHFASSSAAQAKVPVAFKGPFDYVTYNDDSIVTPPPPLPAPGDLTYYSVNRPAPWAYAAGLAQSGRGVEVELLQTPGGPPTILAGKTFTDPAALNSLGTPDIPVLCFASQLRYRVRFCYPVDPLVDPGGGIPNVDKKPSVDPTVQYLLDTPVFDDISVAYIMTPKILAFREVSE